MSHPSEFTAPFHPEAEKTVIGCLLSLDKVGELLIKTFDRIDPEAFHVPGYADLARWLIARRSEDKPVDIVSFVTDIQGNAGLAEIFGKAWGENYVAEIAEIHGAALTTAHFSYHVGQIRDAWHRRKALVIAMEFQERLKNPEGKTATTIISECQEALTCIATDINEVQSEAELAHEALANIEQMMTSDEPLGYTTGFETLDSKMTIMPGTVITIAAATSVGKTSFGLQIADHLCDAAGPGLFLTKEMTKVELAYKQLTASVRRDVTKIKAGEDAAIQQLNESAATMVQRDRLHIKEMPVMTITLIETLVRIYTARGFKWFAFDYLQLMDPTAETAKLDRASQLTDITRRMKTLALSTNAILIDLCQVKRSTGPKHIPPTINSGSGSKSIEEDSDQVILLDRPIGSREGKVKIAKDRRGGTSEWLDLEFDLDSQTYRDC